jgi:ankyrin repeat protein
LGKSISSHINYLHPFQTNRSSLSFPYQHRDLPLESKMEISLGSWPVSDDPSLPPLLKDLEGNSALKLARKGDDIEAIAKLVQLENEKFKRLNGWGYARSLNVAAKDGDMVVIDRLLRANADVITPGASRFDPSALEEAAGAGHFDIVKRLLEAESAITSVDGYYNLSAVEAAVESGQHKEVERLLKAKKMLDYAADNKCKALKVAAGVRDMRIGKLLVESGAAVNDTEIDGQRYSALTNAAGVGNLDMVEYLLQLGADLSGGKHSKFPKKSPLRAAAEGGHITMVNKLLEVGAPIDETKPLHGAARAGHVDIVRRLLDAGAPVDGDKKCVQQYNDPTPRMHQCELTALQEAARGGHLQIVDMLLEADADVNVLASDFGHTAVQAAAESGSIDVVKRLLVAGASVNEPAPRGGRTALQAAAFGGNLEMLNFLLDAGAQTETKVADYTVPAIVLASQEGHFAIFQKLLEHMNAQDANETVSIRVDALQKAAEKGHLEIVKALLEANTPAIQDNDKERYSPSPLELAVRRGNVEIVGLLIGAKADTDATRVPGRTETPLQIAVANGRIDLVDLLLSAGAQVNTYESKIPSALHTAAEKGTFEMVQILLDAGADVNAKTYEGETILQAAEKGGKENILKLLQARREEVAAEAAAVEAEWEIVSDVPINDDQSLCMACSKIPLDLFEPGKMFGGRRFDLHPSLFALQRSAQSGCPFCVFLWKRLSIKEITLPQPSVVPLYPGMGREGYMQTQITEPYPEDIERPRQLITGFDFSVEPFEGKYYGLFSATQD